MTRPGYIFIVGLPRTGTALIRNILNCSEDVTICKGESHFFGDSRILGIIKKPGMRQRLAKVGDIATDEGAEKVVDFIYTLQDRFWGSISKTIDREEFLRLLLASDRSDRSLLELAMISCSNGRAFRGEKTPAHIYSVPTLLDWFPTAKIIHTVRDPRAVYISNKKKVEKRKLPLYSSLARRSGVLFELYSSFDVILAWLRVIRLHRDYQQLYPSRYYVSRYEDLIKDPRPHLTNLCDFLGIRFTEAMLQQTVINSSFVPRDQIQGFDTSSLERWRKSLHPLISKWFAFWCGEHLLEFGYRL
jgi:hypothetical protein